MHFSQIITLVAAVFVSEAVTAPTPDLELQKRATGPAYTNADFIKSALTTHNTHRAAHHVSNLVWDTTLAKYANKYANKCVFQHTGGPYGENLYAIFPGYSNYVSGTEDGVMAWVNEVQHYNYSKPGFSDATGHFTQVVWKGSTKVGCSWNTVACKGAAYLFCEYNAPGNIIGHFPENVFPVKLPQKSS